MKALSIVLLLIVTISGERPSVCKICSCNDRKTVRCDLLELTQSFDPSAWQDIVGPGSNFTSIKLDHNRIGRVTQFPYLNVTSLELQNNEIVQIDDAAFRNLTRLEHLDLSENQLTTENLRPNVFQGRYNLEYYEPLSVKTLDLSGNELHSLQAYVFEHLPFLQQLRLKRNSFKILDKQTVIAISSLQRLEVLDLSYAEITYLPSGFLHSLKRLTDLSLKGNYLQEVPSSILYESHKLVSLNLNYNPIVAITTENPFPEMPSLRILEISHMPVLKRIEAFSMSGLTGLTVLRCRVNSNLEDISPLAFARSENDTSRPNVTTLCLNDNALRYLNESFLRMYDMKYIDVLSNKWSCDCENQWMVTNLVPILLRTHSPVNSLMCSEPDPMAGKKFLMLYKHKYEMRCLDYYGNHPENDSVILITVFSLIIAAMAIGLIVVWKARVGSCRRGRSTSVYDRALYKITSSEDRLHGFHQFRHTRIIADDDVY